jgi:uncharacterized protein DUF2630
VIFVVIAQDQNIRCAIAFNQNCSSGEHGEAAQWQMNPVSPRTRRRIVRSSITSASGGGRAAALPAPAPTDAEQDRLRKINVELDQYWDLLCQRRALRTATSAPVPIEPRMSIGCSSRRQNNTRRDLRGRDECRT